MLFRKIILLGHIFFCLTFSLCAEETTASSYFSGSLEQVENEYGSSSKKLSDQLNFVRKTHGILLDFLFTAEEEQFYEQLRLFKPSSDLLTEVSNAIFYQLNPHRYADRQPYQFDGASTYIYNNIFSQKHPLTDEERTAAYEQEVNRHKGIRVLPKQPLTQETKQTLIPGQPYNFILNIGNEAYVSYDQRYRLKGDDGKTLLISPTHTFLSENHSLLSAGILYFYKVGKKELFVISSSSGHFHPTPDSLIHMKKYLIALGVPDEAIILMSLTYNSIVSEAHRIKYSTSTASAIE